MIAGAGVMALGHLWQVAVGAGAAGLPWLVPGLLAEGAGIGMVMAPLVAAVLAVAPVRHAGVASGVLATVQQVGNALGVAVISAVHALGRPGTALAGASSGFSLSMFFLIAVCAALCLVLWLGQARWQPRR